MASTCLYTDVLLVHWSSSHYGLQKEVPDLLEILQQKGLADQVGLLEHANLPSTGGQDATEHASLYQRMHSILARICEGKPNSWQGRNIAGTAVSLYWPSCC